MTWSAGGSTLPGRTAYGSWTSPSTPPGKGKVYLAVVLDAFSRRVVGWSIADHIRAELVVDAVQMAIWRRRPPQGQTIAHSDHGCRRT
jgi:transposase InsO family protein